MSVSICMIVKNEEACLPRALANWRELADELIIVDTGSTDRTVEIAKEHGATVLHYDWRYPGHKGEARNVGLDAAQGDWIVVLDADEVIVDPAGLRQMLLQPPDPAATAVNVQFANFDEAGRETLRWYQVRVFRRGLYRYIYREHEIPIWCGGDGMSERAVAYETVFEHRAPADRAAGKSQPMLERLRLDVEEHPDDPHPLYFLHRQYLINGDPQTALEWGQRYIDMPHNHIRAEAYGNMANAAAMLGDGAATMRWLHLAASEQPERRVWWIRLAQQYMAQQRWQLALAHLRLASELWPVWQWQWEPETDHDLLYQLIDHCQRALHATHTH